MGNIFSYETDVFDFCEPYTPQCDELKNFSLHLQSNQTFTLYWTRENPYTHKLAYCYKGTFEFDGAAYTLHASVIEFVGKGTAIKDAAASAPCHELRGRIVVDESLRARHDAAEAAAAASAAASLPASGEQSVPAPELEVVAAVPPVAASVPAGRFASELRFPHRLDTDAVVMRLSASIEAQPDLPYIFSAPPQLMTLRARFLDGDAKSVLRIALHEASVKQTAGLEFRTFEQALTRKK